MMIVICSVVVGFLLCSLPVCPVFCLDFCFFKQQTAYEMRISDWSSDVCSSDLHDHPSRHVRRLSCRADRSACAGLWRESGSGQERATNAQIGRASCRERVCKYG